MATKNNSEMDNEMLGGFFLLLLGMLIYALYEYGLKVYEYSEVNFRFSFVVSVKKREAGYP